jgi:hypothetical protein
MANSPQTTQLFRHHNDHTVAYDDIGQRWYVEIGASKPEVVFTYNRSQAEYQLTIGPSIPRPIDEILAETPRFLHARPTETMPGMSIFITKALVEAAGRIDVALVSAHGMNAHSNAVWYLTAREQRTFDGTYLQWQATTFDRRPAMKVLITNPFAYRDDYPAIPSAYRRAQHQLVEIKPNAINYLFAYAREPLRGNLPAYIELGSARGWYFHEDRETGRQELTSVIYFDGGHIFSIKRGAAWEFANAITNSLAYVRQSNRVNDLYIQHGTLFTHFSDHPHIWQELNSIAATNHPMATAASPLFPFSFVNDVYPREHRANWELSYGEYVIDPAYVPPDEE